MKRLNLQGKLFGNLRVVSLDSCIDGETLWDCLCSCGKTTKVIGNYLTSGHTKSCGCLRHLPYARTHGETGFPLHRIWEGIIDRCHCKSSLAYPKYGGMGITVCTTWKNSYLVFRKWALTHGYRVGLQIDRKSNTMGYISTNCRWVTPKEQQNNRTNNHMITHMGQTKPLMVWCEEIGISPGTIRGRIRKGWNTQLLIPPIPPQLSGKMKLGARKIWKALHE